MTQYKRHPKGVPEGGQFAPGEGGGSSSSRDTAQSRGFTEQEQIELQDYAEGNYKNLNEYLRDPSSIRASLGVEYDSQISTIDAAIEKSTLARDVTVYRGVQHPTLARNADKLVGRTVESPSFMSTTMNPDVAKSFAGYSQSSVVLKLTAKKGTKALNMEPFKKSAMNRGEAEVLFGRGSRVRITGVERTSSGTVVLGEFV